MEAPRIRGAGRPSGTRTDVDRGLAAREGGTLEAVCSSFAEGPDPAAAHAAIASWFAEGWIAGVERQSHGVPDGDVTDLDPASVYV